jgi:hypothetical protein
MKRAKIIYEEKSVLTAKYYHPKSDDYLNYISIIRIKDSGKNPIEMAVKFEGILPFVGTMPPKEHTFKAPSILEMHMKIVRWLKKYGYILV